MEYTVKAYAAREQVTQRTVYTWIQKGAVTVRRTPGGGIRILEDDNVLFVKIDEDARKPAA